MLSSTMYYRGRSGSLIHPLLSPLQGVGEKSGGEAVTGINRLPADGRGAYLDSLITLSQEGIMLSGLAFDIQQKLLWWHPVTWLLDFTLS